MRTCILCTEKANFVMCVDGTYLPIKMWDVHISSSSIDETHVYGNYILGNFSPKLLHFIGMRILVFDFVCALGICSECAGIKTPKLA